MAKKQYLLTAFLLIVLVTGTTGQNIRRFQDVGAELSAEEKFKFGNKLMEQEKYHSAIDFFIKVLEEDELHTEATYQLATCYEKIRDYDKASIKFQKLIQRAVKDYPLLNFRYGMNAKAAGKSEEAESALKNFIRKNQPAYPSQVKLAKWALESLESDTGVPANTSKVTVSIMDPSNRNQMAEFGTTQLSEDEVIFTGVIQVPQSRKLNIGGSKAEYDNYFVNRLFSAKPDRSGLPESEVLKIKLPRDAEHIGSPFFQEDGEKLYYTICNTENRECAIYYSQKKSGNKWSAPVRLNEHVNVPGSENRHATWSKDQFNREYIFFSSNRPGGEGGFDIWYSKLDESGNPAPAINLGAAVNTAQSEVTPFFDNGSNLLFFSSDGHRGMGQLDVYMVTVDFSALKGKIYNAGTPINSPADDYYFSLTREGRGGFLSSNRVGTVIANQNTVSDNIYKLSFNEPFTYKNLPDYLSEADTFNEDDNAFKLFNEAFDYKNLAISEEEASKINENDITIDGSIIRDDQDGDEVVYLMDESKNIIDSTRTDKNGKFQFRNLPGDKDYSVFLEGDDDTQANMTFLNEDGEELLRVNSRENKRYFHYRLLSDQSTAAQKIDESSIDISGNLLKDGLPVANEKVVLINENGKVIDGGYTDSEGKFHFRNLANSEKYMLRMDDKENMKANMDFFDEDNNLLLSTNSEDNTAYFDYKDLSGEVMASRKLTEDDAEFQKPQADPASQLKNQFKWTMTYDQYNELVKKHGENLTKDVNLRVQIGAFRKPQEGLFSDLNLGKIDIVNSKGLTKFLIGNFRELEEAEVLRKQAFDRGISDAFVSVYYRGTRVALLIYNDKNQLVRKFTEGND